MKKTVLIIAAHPDDDVLGCGGTIAKFADEGASVHVSFLSDGVFSRENDTAKGLLKIDARRLAAKKAADILGVESISFGNFPDNKMDIVPRLEIVQNIELLIKRFLPQIIITHHVGDLNIDHRRTHEAVVVTARPQKVGRCIETLLFFEVPSSTEWQIPGSAPAFSPNWFIDISKTMDRKLLALTEYREELHEWPHPRSLKGVESLANWRGSIIGVDAAEAFILGRQIV